MWARVSRAAVRANQHQQNHQRSSASSWKNTLAASLATTVVGSGVYWKSSCNHEDSINNSTRQSSVSSPAPPSTIQSFNYYTSAPSVEKYIRQFQNMAWNFWLPIFSRKEQSQQNQQQQDEQKNQQQQWFNNLTTTTEQSTHCFD